MYKAIAWAQSRSQIKLFKWKMQQTEISTSGFGKIGPSTWLEVTDGVNAMAYYFHLPECGESRKSVCACATHLIIMYMVYVQPT